MFGVKATAKIEASVGSTGMIGAMSGFDSGFSASLVRVTGLGCTASRTFRWLLFSRRCRNLDVLDMLLDLFFKLNCEWGSDGFPEHLVGSMDCCSQRHRGGSG